MNTLLTASLPLLLTDQPLSLVAIDKMIIAPKQNFSSSKTKFSIQKVYTNFSKKPPFELQKTAFAPSLGSITKSNSAFDLPPLKSMPKHVNKRNHAFAMQSGAGSLLPAQRVGKCMCHRFNTDKQITITHNGASGKDGRARYTNLMLCGSIWTCYFCARKLLAERGAEVEHALEQWTVEQGNSVFMLTLTVPHYQGGDLDNQLKLQAQANKRLFNDRIMRKIWQLVGKVGQIKALEYTHGKNGHHNHTHAIVFSKLPPSEFKNIILPISKTAQNNHTLLSDKQVQKLKDKGLERKINYMTLEQFIKFYWVKVCKDVGLGIASLEHGANITDANNAKTYLTKLKTAQELTNVNSKSGKNGNRNQWQLLSDYLDGDANAGHIFKVYASAFTGQRQLFWSAGLKELFGILSKKDKALLVDEHSCNDIDIVEIQGDVWNLIRKKKLEAHLLYLAEIDFKKGSKSLSALLDSLLNEVINNRQKIRQKNSNQISYEKWLLNFPPVDY